MFTGAWAFSEEVDTGMKRLPRAMASSTAAFCDDVAETVESKQTTMLATPPDDGHSALDVTP